MAKRKSTLIKQKKWWRPKLSHKKESKRDRDRKLKTKRRNKILELTKQIEETTDKDEISLSELKWPFRKNE